VPRRARALRDGDESVIGAFKLTSAPVHPSTRSTKARLL
jgi:hypothetical protein